jgi:hypothetical protein
VSGSADEKRAQLANIVDLSVLEVRVCVGACVTMRACSDVVRCVLASVWRQQRLSFRAQVVLG